MHQWGLHADDRAVIAAMVEPRENLFTCGESFSDYQGWVEGALRSADLVLDKGFGLAPISEVFREEHGQSANDVVAGSYDSRAAELIRTYIDPGPSDPAEPVPAQDAAPAEREDFGVSFRFLVPPVPDHGE